MSIQTPTEGNPGYMKRIYFSLLRGVLLLCVTKKDKQHNGRKKNNDLQNIT